MANLDTTRRIGAERFPPQIAFDMNLTLGRVERWERDAVSSQIGLTVQRKFFFKNMRVIAARADIDVWSWTGFVNV